MCRTDCRFCDGTVVCIESPRPVVVADTGASNFDGCAGLIVARAECVDCEGKYLAWLNHPRSWGHARTEDIHVQLDDNLAPVIRDLSFRSSFNDEPGENDLPRHEIVVTRSRVPVSPENYWHQHYGRKGVGS